MRHPALRDRSRYFITFTDDYSRYGFVFFLKNKSDALQCFKEFTAYCRTQFDLPVRCLRSDNGGEYFSNSFSEFLLENGIQRDATVPHTPQQNGVNERVNRTLVECARSILHFCKAPLRFWAEAVSHAMYLRNWTYSSSTPGMTPFERLWKSKPDLGNLRIFGCEAYAHVEPHQRSKFASKTIRAMYLGHETYIKGYRLYTSRPERTIVSRNVVFNETKSFFTDEPAADESPVSQLLDEIDDDDDDELFPLQLMNLRAFQDVPRRSTRIRRGNPRYNVPPVYVPPPASVGSSTPPITQVERTTPILADNPSMPCVENPPQPSDASMTSRVEPVQQQSSAESPADIPLPSSPPQAPMSRMDAPVVTPEFVPIMMSSTAPTSFSSFDEDALCEQFEFMALSVYCIFCPDDVNSDVDEQQLNKQHRLLVAFALQTTGLPSTIRQAHASPEKAEWIKATDAEYNSLMHHNTWTLCELPPDRKPIGCRWIFTKKYAADGTLSRYKARLVAQGFTQVAGVDYTEVFAPVIRTSSIRFLLALAAMYSMHICHMDVQTAFLNGSLQETLFMKQPPGYVQPGSENLVCRLNKSIYGLKQSSREWNSALDSYFKSQRFAQLKTDPCIYFRRTPQGLVLVGVYVDDFILLSTNVNILDSTKRALSSRFTMKDLGPLTYCLGIEVERLEDGSILLHQSKYVSDILAKHDLANCNPVSTPQDSHSAAFHSSSSSPSLPFRTVVGELLYLTTTTRPDIAFTVTLLSRHLNNPEEEHQHIAKRVLRYLRGSKDFGICYSKQDSTEFTIELYVDADYANDAITRRSTSGYLLYLNGCLISWKSKLQNIVALSTSEAEYISMSYGLQEALWLKSLLEELQLPIKLAIIVYEDNQSSLLSR
ncbi:hypothetical protein AeRB84_015057 [Aphanomyces euteiches]|nr:hypothetical protein AeRB84_015057 [Aphanomyces euteiches]